MRAGSRAGGLRGGGAPALLSVQGSAPPSSSAVAAALYLRPSRGRGRDGLLGRSWRVGGRCGVPAASRARAHPRSCHLLPLPCPHLSVLPSILPLLSIFESFQDCTSLCSAVSPAASARSTSAPPAGATAGGQGAGRLLVQGQAAHVHEGVQPRGKLSSCGHHPLRRLSPPRRPARPPAHLR